MGTDCGEEMMKAAEAMRKQRVPPLFREIMDHEKTLRKRLDGPVVGLHEAGAAVRRKRELMRAAEQALSWNHNKGNTAR